ncbi:hypothetical protein [Actinoplanes sp. NPDC051851]|uniref:hypothetical protein n=1 Tax=Actinoplanes sp. NPDC051851 TaxID=3154753 RepID=UPI0034205950
MTIVSALLIAAVVLAVRLVSSVRLKAAVYSLPIPMTLALLGSGGHVDARHLLGVVLLVLFFVTVGTLYRRGVPILLADGLGVAAYLLVAWPLTALDRLPFLPVLAAVVLLWTIAAARRPPGLRAAPERLGPLSVLLVVGAALLTAPLGGALQGFVVTFPYSGVLVVVETRRSLAAFTRQFARAALALVAFLAAFHYVQPYGTGWALAAAWTTHLTITAALLLTPARYPSAHR